MWNWTAALGQLNLDLSVLCAGLVFLLPLKRRGRFPLRLGLCLAGGAALSLGFYALRPLLGVQAPGSILLDGVWMGALFLALTAQCCLCTRCRLSAGAYCAAWALVAQQLVHECWLTFCMFSSVDPDAWWLGDAWFAVCYMALALTVARWMPHRGEYHVGPRQLALAVLMALLSGALYELSFYITARDGALILRIIVTLVQFYCATVLYLQNVLFQKSAMRQELMTLELLWQQTKAQYSLSKENIDLINRKCHDLKHQMRALQSMAGSEERTRCVAELEQSIQIYDSIVKTGNEALDTILTEKSLYCEANHILVNCVADGSRLDFIHPVDLYAIFGNALSNAIECVQQISDPGKRVIDVLVYVKRQFLAISITNPLNGDLRFEDGLPVTTKEKNGYHGFGLKSVRHTAGQYGGFVTVDVDHGCFSLRILFPLPGEQ